MGEITIMSTRTPSWSTSCSKLNRTWRTQPLWESNMIYWWKRFNRSWRCSGSRTLKRRRLDSAKSMKESSWRSSGRARKLSSTTVLNCTSWLQLRLHLMLLGWFLPVLEGLQPSFIARSVAPHLSRRCTRLESPASPIRKPTPWVPKLSCKPT